MWWFIIVLSRLQRTRKSKIILVRNLFKNTWITSRRYTTKTLNTQNVNYSISLIYSHNLYWFCGTSTFTKRLQHYCLSVSCQGKQYSIHGKCVSSLVRIECFVISFRTARPRYVLAHYSGLGINKNNLKLHTVRVFVQQTVISKNANVAYVFACMQMQ